MTSIIEKAKPLGEWICGLGDIRFRELKNLSSLIHSTYKGTRGSNVIEALARHHGYTFKLNHDSVRFVPLDERSDEIPERFQPSAWIKEHEASTFDLFAIPSVYLCKHLSGCMMTLLEVYSVGQPIFSCMVNVGHFKDTVRPGFGVKCLIPVITWSPNTGGMNPKLQVMKLSPTQMSNVIRMSQQTQSSLAYFDGSLNNVHPMSHLPVPDIEVLKEFHQQFRDHADELWASTGMSLMNDASSLAHSVKASFMTDDALLSNLYVD